MGIYISGVKGLPEQVQANKEDIKTIKEEIEGIDFEEIRQLENQVAENTQDINNLEASIGVQNQAINTLRDDVDALESKTQLMSYNDDLGQTEFSNNIKVADGVYATSLNVVGDGTIVNTSGSGLHFQEGANDDDLVLSNKESGTAYNLTLHANGIVSVDGNLEADNVDVAGNGTFKNANGSGLHFQEGINDDEVALVNKESGTPHDLTLHADGTLTLDGGPVGAKPLYQHDLTFYIDLAPTKVRVSIMVINDSNTSINYNGLVQFLSNNNMVNINTGYSASGFLMLTISSVKYNYIVASVYASSGGTSLTFESLDLTNNDRYEYAVPTNINVNDKIIQIA